jgi:hypothetical protein
MTAETLTSLSNFMNDMVGPLQETFPKRTVLSDELRRNTRRSNFVGRQVKIPLILNTKQGTGGFSETGGPNVARQINDNVAFITMARLGHAIELSLDLMKAVEGRDWAAAGDALKLHMDQAEIAMSRVQNEMVWGSGDALIAAITVGTGPSATVTVGTSANFYQLYPGRVVDLLVRSSGATLSLAREIVSNDPVAGTVTLDASVTTLTTHGIYIEGSYGNAMQGLRQPFATTGTFQGVNLANVVQFRGIEGRGASPAAADLSMPILDGGTRRLIEASGGKVDFYVGDPAVIDKYGHGLVAQFRWEPKITRLQTGWEGIDYRGVPLIPDPDAPFGELYGINKKAITFYGYEQGPNWDETTGTKFQRFARNAPVEAWLLDFVQLGFHKPNALVRLPVLNRAA